MDLSAHRLADPRKCINIGYRMPIGNGKVDQVSTPDPRTVWAAMVEPDLKVVVHAERGRLLFP